MDQITKPRPKPGPEQCTPPSLPVCTLDDGGNLVCRCAATGGPSPVEKCTVSIVYPEGAPHKAYLAAQDCTDAASIELALAVVLAKLLGAPPAP